LLVGCAAATGSTTLLSRPSSCMLKRVVVSSTVDCSGCSACHWWLEASSCSCSRKSLRTCRGVGVGWGWGGGGVGGWG
jgi:hypothetical protein